MGHMSDLHLLAERVLDGESVYSVAADSVYPVTDIRWAADELRKS